MNGPISEINTFCCECGRPVKRTREIKDPVCFICTRGKKREAAKKSLERKRERMAYLG